MVMVGLWRRRSDHHYRSRPATTSLFHWIFWDFPKTYRSSYHMGSQPRLALITPLSVVGLQLWPRFAMPIRRSRPQESRVNPRDIDRQVPEATRFISIARVFAMLAGPETCRDDTRVR